MRHNRIGCGLRVNMRAMRSGTNFEVTTDEARVIADMARWMRLVAHVYLALGISLAAGGLFVLVNGDAVFMVVIMSAAVVVLLSGRWLRRSAHAFQRGHDAVALGVGFRELRPYFMLAGALSLLQLAYQLAQLAR